MLITNLSILVLSGFVGYAVISKVPNTLHTPLMSGTNAIHGIVVLGGLLLLATGNRIAAVGMVIAVITTLLVQHFHNPLLIIAGLIIGTAVGVPAARNVKMTA